MLQFVLRLYLDMYSEMFIRYIHTFVYVHRRDIFQSPYVHVCGLASHIDFLLKSVLSLHRKQIKGAKYTTYIVIDTQILKQIILRRSCSHQISGVLIF